MTAEITHQLKKSPLIKAGIIIGIGQAGFFDGIVLHQLLQWHHMFSNLETDSTIFGLKLNVLGDGIFGVFSWLITILGIVLLWRVGTRDDVLKSSRVFLGSVLIGIGIFNLVEGVIDHQILGIHHVKSGDFQLAYDFGFLLINAIIAAIGLIVVKTYEKK